MFRVPTLALAAFLILAAVGCGPKAEPVSQSAPPPAPPPAQATPAAVASVEEGKATFASACTACHGRDGKGLPKLGKNLVDSEWVRSKSDEQVAELIRKGRDTSDPENTSKVAMPPKGGNPALTDAQIASVVAYLRSLQNGGS